MIARAKRMSLPFLFRAADGLGANGKLIARSFGTELEGVFTRTGPAFAQDDSGRLIVATHGVPRLGTRAAIPSLLLEPGRTNLCLRSQEFDHATWSKTNAGSGSVPVVTANAATAPDGNQSGDRVVFVAPGAGDRSILSQGSITTVTSSVYSGALWVKASAAADVGKVLLLRHVAGVGYLDVTLTAVWQRVSVVEVAAGTSSAFTIELRPGTGGSSSGTVTALLWQAHLELGFEVSSDIATTTASASRSAEAVYFPLACRPQATTIYLRFVEGSNPQVTTSLDNTFLLHLGPAGGGTPRLGVYRKSTSAAGYLAYTNVSANRESGMVGASAAVGDVVELRAVYASDGTILIGASINGGPEALSTPSAAAAAHTSWGSDSRLYIGSFVGVSAGLAAFSHVALQFGDHSLAAMRALAEVG